MYLVANVGLCMLAHAFIQGFVVDKIVKVFCNSLVVTSLDEKAALSVLDLQWYSADKSRNDRFSLCIFSM